MSSQSLLCDRFSTLLEQINFDRDQIVKLLPYHVLVPKDLGCDHLLECAQGVKFLIFFLCTSTKTAGCKNPFYSSSCEFYNLIVIPTFCYCGLHQYLIRFILKCRYLKLNEFSITSHKIHGITASTTRYGSLMIMRSSFSS